MAADPFVNLRFSPRPYQAAAFSKWQAYYRTHNSSEPLQVLFNLATGAGKTYLMAAIMLDLYVQGYRNFIFFVNSLNILEKTRDNFINPGSPKYLFRPNLILQNRWVKIREVTNFADSDPTAINILFTTTQRLHADLSVAHENRLTLYDFKAQNIVLLGDEAHHNNAKSLSSAAAEQRSWENTIEQILSVNPQTLLLEFTATMDFDHPEIFAKYQNRVLYQYDLRQFCQDQYSKSVLLYHASNDLDQRILSALVLSEYRQLVAEKNHLPIKPVILFKSRTIYDNQTNLRHFIQLLANLQPEQLFSDGSELQSETQTFLDRQGITLAEFCNRIKADFAPERLIRIDGGRTISVALQQQINTLEAPDNRYRAIFAVDMLKEGWDVLNLFDIVRLYDEHRPGKTTISEIQLIGRGARYYPFFYASCDPFKRKFDQSPDHELRILEQLHYHTSQDVQYITELTHDLKKAGLMDTAAKA